MSTDTNGSTQALTPLQEKRVAIRDAMEAGGRAMAIVPRTFAELQGFCAALASSMLVPDKLRERSADIFVIVAAGMELGIPPMSALRLYHVIEGVPRLSADGIASVCQAHPSVAYLECREMTPERVTWAMKRGDRPEQTRTWTKERAVRAKLWDRKNRDGSDGNWQKYPERMLSARAKAELCRDVCGDLAAGLVSAEEAFDGAIDAEFREVPSSGNFVAPAPQTLAPPTPVATPTATLDPPPAKPKSTRKAAANNPPIDVASTPAPNAPPTPATSGTHAPRLSEQRASERPVESAPPSASQAEPEPSFPTETDTGSAPPLAVVPPPVDDGGFGGEDPVDSAPVRTMEGFRAALAKIQKGPTAHAELEAAKEEWKPWSVDMTVNPPKPQPWAKEMRDAFAKTKAELGL